MVCPRILPAWRILEKSCVNDLKQRVNQDPTKNIVFPKDQQNISVQITTHAWWVVIGMVFLGA